MVACNLNWFRLCAGAAYMDVCCAFPPKVVDWANARPEVKTKRHEKQVTSRLNRLVRNIASAFSNIAKCGGRLKLNSGIILARHQSAAAFLINWGKNSPGQTV